MIRTISYESVLNEDGTTTTTEVTNYTPPTKKQQATAWAAFTAVCLAPFAPIVAIHVWERHLEKREARKAAKTEAK